MNEGASLAGADTTGAAIQALLIYAFATPGVYDKIMAEITTAPISYPVPSYSEVVAHCPYYIACIREALRLFPPASTIMPRVVDPPGLHLYGKFAPAGTEITCNPYTTGRSRELYGADAEEFRPERWIENADKLTEWERMSLAFGAGSRSCLYPVSFTPPGRSRVRNMLTRGGRGGEDKVWEGISHIWSCIKRRSRFLDGSTCRSSVMPDLLISVEWEGLRILSLSSAIGFEAITQPVHRQSPARGVGFYLFVILYFIYLYPTTCGPKGHGSGSAATLRQLAANICIFLRFPLILSPSGGTRSNPWATMPSWSGFPFPFLP